MMNTLGGVFEQSTDAVFGINTAGVIQFANQSFGRLMGYSCEKVRGLQCADILCGTNLLGQTFCGPNCPIPKTVSGQPEISDFDLVVRNSDGDSVMVNVGTSYISPRMRKNYAQADVIFSMRQVNPQRILQRMAASHIERPAANSGGYGQLTSREKEILGLAVKGLNTSQIARQLFISALTVRSHFKNIYPKLGVNSRTEAVVYMMEHGIH